MHIYMYLCHMVYNSVKSHALPNKTLAPHIGNLIARCYL